MAETLQSVLNTIMEVIRMIKAFFEELMTEFKPEEPEA